MTDPAPLPCIIIDTRGNLWGPFENGKLAVEWAKKKWPGQQQDEDHEAHMSESGRALGWDIVSLRAPD